MLRQPLQSLEQQFVAFGADINYRYEDGKTPLMLASSMGSISTVRSLLELGANMNLVSKEKMTALDYARGINNQSIISLLHTDKKQVTPQLSDNELIATIQLYLNISIDFEQNYRVEISERQIETLFNAMSGNEIAKTTKPADRISKKENDLIEIVPTVLIEDLSISETEVINTTR